MLIEIVSELFAFAVLKNLQKKYAWLKLGNILAVGLIVAGAVITLMYS